MGSVVRMVNYVPIDLSQSLDKDEIVNQFKPNTLWNYWSYELLSDTTKYPKLHDYIAQLPFKEICTIKINVQTKEVTPHIDFVVDTGDLTADQRNYAHIAGKESLELYKNNVKNEPCGYRIVVKGKNDVLQLHQHKQLTCYKPYDTDCYVINHTGAVHSVTNDIGRITIYISGFIDREKHLKLLKRSMNKYSEYVI
tara:strand:+ start:97 stop:684 length:588 start_codon:yes stop_codon:yes gene_type:complete